MFNKKHTKKGFTMMEIIFVLIVLGVLVALVFPTVIGGKNKATIGATVTNDMKLIGQALTEWRGNSANSNGTYSNLTTSEIVAYLPSSMTYDNATDTIKSSGLNGGISYQVISDNINSDGDSVKIYVDFSKVINDQSLDERTISYGETDAMNKIVSIATDKTTARNGMASDATALGNANADFDRGGNDTDGYCGVRQVRF